MNSWKYIFVVCLFCTRGGKSILPPECASCQSSGDCKPPECVCCDDAMTFPRRQQPQIVFLTFDDAVGGQIIPYYKRLFRSDRLNPNGCPIAMTLFVSDEYTNYDEVKYFFDKGMEIAVHSVTHSHITPEKFLTEASDMIDNLIRSGIPAAKITGWRSPFLEITGDTQFQNLSSLGFTYDATLTVGRLGTDGKGFPKPFTLDHGWPFPCHVEKCPDDVHPGFWEVPIVELNYSPTGPCVYVDACPIPPNSKESAYDLLWSNFLAYYEGNRAPMGLNMHAGWFYDSQKLAGMDDFLSTLTSMEDVYIVTVSQVIDWMKQPANLADILQGTLPSWSCDSSVREKKGMHDVSTNQEGKHNLSTHKQKLHKIIKQKQELLESRKSKLTQNNQLHALMDSVNSANENSLIKSINRFQSSLKSEFLVSMFGRPEGGSANKLNSNIHSVAVSPSALELAMRIDKSSDSFQMSPHTPYLSNVREYEGDTSSQNTLEDIPFGSGTVRKSRNQLMKLLGPQQLRPNHPHSITSMIFDIITSSSGKEEIDGTNLITKSITKNITGKPKTINILILGGEGKYNPMMSNRFKNESLSSDDSEETFNINVAPALTNDNITDSYVIVHASPTRGGGKGLVQQKSVTQSEFMSVLKSSSSHVFQESKTDQNISPEFANFKRTNTQQVIPNPSSQYLMRIEKDYALLPSTNHNNNVLRKLNSESSSNLAYSDLINLVSQNRLHSNSQQAVNKLLNPVKDTNNFRMYSFLRLKLLLLERKCRRRQNFWKILVQKLGLSVLPAKNQPSQ